MGNGGKAYTKLRIALAKLPLVLRLEQAPEKPVSILRDLWVGSPVKGVSLIKGEWPYSGKVYPFGPQHWDVYGQENSLGREFYSFSWLRDMRALGTDTARIAARAQIAMWMQQKLLPDIAYSPGVIGARLFHCLSHYDFFAASAEDDYRRRLMKSLLAEGRTAKALLATVPRDQYYFSLMKGVLAVGVAMPDCAGLIPRVFQVMDAEIERQVDKNGVHKSLSPQVQFEVLRDLVEIRSLLKVAYQSVPDLLTERIDKMCAVLRSMRHGDGKLVLFNSSIELSVAEINTLLLKASRLRVMPNSHKLNGFVRFSAAKSMVFLDAGTRPAAPFVALSHSEVGSFEFSVGYQRIIVNCGFSSNATWQKFLKQPEAHSSVEIYKPGTDIPSLPYGYQIRERDVTDEYFTADGACWYNLHCNFSVEKGVERTRRLYLAANGEDLRGEDVITAPESFDAGVRFHLHPDIKVTPNLNHREVLLSMPSERAMGQHWVFKVEGGRIFVMESVYLGNGQVQPSTQLVVVMDNWQLPVDPALAEPGQAMVGEENLHEQPGLKEQDGMGNPVGEENKTGSRNGRKAAVVKEGMAGIENSAMPVSATPPLATKQPEGGRHSLLKEGGTNPEHASSGVQQPAGGSVNGSMRASGVEEAAASADCLPATPETDTQDNQKGDPARQEDDFVPVFRPAPSPLTVVVSAKGRPVRLTYPQSVSEMASGLSVGKVLPPPLPQKNVSFHASSSGKGEENTTSPLLYEGGSLSEKTNPLPKPLKEEEEQNSYSYSSIEQAVFQQLEAGLYTKRIRWRLMRMRIHARP